MIAWLKFFVIAVWRRKDSTAFYAALYVLVIEPECRTTPIECGNIQFGQDSCLKPEQETKTFHEVKLTVPKVNWFMKINSTGGKQRMLMHLNTS